MSGLRRLAATATTLVLAGCGGWSVAPTDVTATTATLRAQAACAAETTDNPCTFWWQYWADGAGGVTSTVHREWNQSTGGNYADVDQAVTGLSADTVYRSQFCGFGDSNVPQPGTCVGQRSNPVSNPGQQPDAGDLSATQNFRTAGNGKVATVDAGRPLSTADTADRRISRDAGLSAAYSATESVWLFGDTVQDTFIPGTTAAAGPYTPGQAPDALRELPTPPQAPAPGRTSPAPFLPTPVNLGCGGGYPASWPSGVVAVPGTQTVLITYAETCVTGPLPAVRLSLALYDPATNRITRTATPFVAASAQTGLPTARRLGSPVYGTDGYLYLYAYDAAGVLAARVPAASWATASAYRWWNGSGWSADSATATGVTALPYVGSVHVANYGSRYGMIVQTAFGSGDFRILTAATPAGPWVPGPAGQVPEGCPPPTGCYAIAGHPELSPAGTLWFSWLSGADLNEFGHLRLGSIAW
ncbi:hypothetical protein [Symbioplanes lichenis]|uniref:hypothetical protein n=1 Tax=Symbioplanes lichenis TaxID=1629072 RepID=UPI00273821E5|nr:hypothetical protein [Actinoplanes lichenis]